MFSGENQKRVGQYDPLLPVGTWGGFVVDCYLRYLREVRAFLAQRLGCRETAGDLAQETFVRLLDMSGDTPALGTIQNPRALLYRIAANLATDHFRRTCLHHETPLDAINDEGLICPRPGPEQIVLARRILERLCAEIDRLPPQCRRVFIMARFDEIPQADIAARLGISRNAVEKHLIRALLQLSQHLDESP